MGDVMMFGIARMPYEMAMDDELSRHQFYQNTQRLVAALEAAREDAWQPIATAPRDGRQMILLLTPSRFPQVAFSNTWWKAGFSVECKPTHWRRIEPLPAIDQARGKGVQGA